MEQMKLRHLEDFPARAPLIPPQQGTLQFTHKRTLQERVFSLRCKLIRLTFIALISELNAKAFKTKRW